MRYFAANHTAHCAGFLLKPKIYTSKFNIVSIVRLITHSGDLQISGKGKIGQPFLLIIIKNSDLKVIFATSISRSTNVKYGVGVKILDIEV